MQTAEKEANAVKLRNRLTAAVLTGITLLGTGLSAQYLPALPAEAVETTWSDGIEYTKRKDYYRNDCWSVSGCSRQLTAAEIPSKPSGLSVNYIEYNAFRDCTALETVTIPSSIIRIDNYAFAGCTGLKTVTMPEKCDEGTESCAIYEGAFQDCSSLRSITIPEGFIVVYDKVFHNCTSLTDVSLPESPIVLFGHPFEGTPWMTGQKQKSPVVISGKTLVDGQGSEGSVVIPEGVTTICSYAFSGCDRLTDVKLPDSLRRVGSYAFAECPGLTGITMSENTTSFSNLAFYNSPNLTIRCSGAAADAVRHINKTYNGLCIQYDTTDPADKIAVKLSGTSFPYTGKAVRIGNYVSVTANGRKLTYGTDFETSYMYNVKTCFGSQKAVLTVKFKGRYKGEITRLFTIKPAAPPAPALTTENGKIHVEWDGTILKKGSVTLASGVQVVYCQNSSFDRNDPTFHYATYKRKTSCDLVKFTKPGETWYVKILAFVTDSTGKKHGSWSKPVSITVQ